MKIFAYFYMQKIMFSREWNLFMPYCYVMQKYSLQSVVLNFIFTSCKSETYAATFRVDKTEKINYNHEKRNMK
jgi:hypothetical protein